MVRTWVIGWIVASVLVGCGGPAEDGAAPTTASTESLATAPVFTSFTPAKATQGSTVTITGKGFTASASVAFNGVASTGVTFASATKLRAVVPERATSGPITVTTAAGSASSSTSFLVLPQIDSLSAAAGIAGDTVQLVGSGFTGATVVTIGSVPAAFTFLDDEHLAVVIPGSATTGRLIVTTPAGSDSSPAAFTIENTPKITSFTPTSAELPATLTITGNYFIGTTEVRIGTVTLPTFTVASNKQITATVPLGTATGKVTVLNEAGSAVSKGTFVAVPCADADADSVCDSADRCPGFDDRLDADNDGIPDGCDACPGAATAGQSCGAGKACSAAGACVALRCDANTTGSGVVRGDVIVDGTDTNGDLQRLAGAWCVTGNVYVTGTNLTDLTALQGLAEVAGSLNVGVTLPNCTFPCTSGNTSLTSLHGLESLRRVGGDLHIYEWYSPTQGIGSLAPLSSLGEVGGDLVIDTTNVLPDLRGLENVHSVHNLYIVWNRSLTSLAGIEGIRSATSVDVYDDEQLTDISALRSLSTVPEMFRIYRTAVASLAGLEGLRSVGDFLVYENPQLANLDAVSGLTSVSGQLALSNAPLVTSLTPFAHVTRVNGLQVDGLGVTSLQGLEKLTAVGSLGIANNPNLVDLSALRQVTDSVPYLSVYNNASLQTLADLNGLTGITNLDIEQNASLVSCANLAVTEGSYATIEHNPMLTSLSCLSNVHTLAGLRFDDNDSFTTLEDLSSLSLVQYVELIGNDGLVSLRGLRGLTTPSPAALDIESNSQLTDLRGLEGMTQLSQLYVAQNGALGSLAGLDGLTSVQGWLAFVNNASLPECAVTALTQRLGRTVDYDSGNTGAGDCSQ